MSVPRFSLFRKLCYVLFLRLYRYLTLFNDWLVQYFDFLFLTLFSCKLTTFSRENAFFSNVKVFFTDIKRFLK